VISAEGASVTLDPRRGISFGVSLSHPISGEAHVEADGIYVQKGFNASSGGESAWIKLSYLEAPPLPQV
jgi:hypothetical protein